ncbi:MAG: SusC/RagA family TonB-linked outer membrane protein [Rhodothermales bacterium]
MKKLLAAFWCLLLLPGIALAQNTTISGTVTDTDGEVLIGANVVIESLLFGASTDIDGNYSFEVPASHVGQNLLLTAKYIGYSMEVRTITVTAGTMTENFVLQADLLHLDEVVVTGVADATPKKKLAFTVDRVSDELVEMAPASNPLSGLHGKVAGASVIAASGQPGDGISVRLRGSTSITGSSQPLYIVDGVILGANQVDLDALDIENIEVVKGAAASSLYGSRAQNGVVQITTKRGTHIPINQTRVTLRNEFGANFMTRNFEPNMSHNFAMNAAGTSFLDKDGNEVGYGPSATIDGGAAVSFFDNPYPGQTFNAFDEFFDPGQTYTNSISVSRNTGTTNFLFSFSNLHEDGVITGQKGYDRRSVRFNLDHRLSQVIDISASGYYSNSTRDAPANVDINPFFGIMFTSPAVSLGERDSDGNLRVKADPLSVEENPLYIIENAEEEQRRSRVLGNFRARYKPVDWFDLEGNFSFDRSDRDNEEFYDKGFELVGSTARELGEIDKNSAVSEALNANLTASFRRTFGELTGRAQFRWAIEDFSSESQFASGTGLAAAGVNDLSNVNTDDKTISTSTSQVRSEAYYGLVGIDYAGKYIADVLVRRDGSSLFGEDERWQTYFRASGAWRLSDENFWPFRDQINEFKLRFSYGTAGARPCFQCQYETFSLSNGQLSKSTLGNKLLKPELQTELEYGVEIGLFDRIFVELVYADSKVEDQLLLIPQPAAVGFSGQWQNAGTLESNTIEASVNATVLSTRDMSLNLGFVFDRTDQTITEFTPPPFRGGPGSRFYIREGEVLGAMYGDLFLSSLSQLPEGVDASQFQVNDDGYVVFVGAGNTFQDGISKSLWGTDSPDFTTPCGTTSYEWGMPILFDNEDCTAFAQIGNTLPDFNLGFNSTFRWKGFTAYMLWNAQIGGDIYNATAQWAYRDDRHRDQDQAGKPDGLKKTANYMQALYHANGTNSHFVEDGDYVKLRELSVEYSFNRAQLTKVFGNALHRIAIGVTGRNLITITNYSGFDPETGDTGGGRNVGGDASLFRVDDFNYPNFRSFTGRITIEF